MVKGRKKRFFYLITLLVPFFFLGLFELSLRFFQVGENAPPLFITNPMNRSQFIMNPAVAERYFPNKDFVTVGAYDPFKKIKTEKTIRIFVQGASSSAGFPFRAASFPRLLEQKLQYYYPNYSIEVVNTSLVATNSYTIRDMVPEILEQQPDMVIIYSGHNEYYGALGVGSSQSLGRYPMVTNFYLRLKNLRIVQLLKKVITRSYGVSTNRNGETLMSQMVQEEQIPHGSKIAMLGVEQYQANLKKTLSDYQTKGVPVLISTLVSNVKDFSPFASSDNAYSAMHAFNEGKKLLLAKDTLLAKQSFEKARDYDLIKFRATSQIEATIPKLAEAYQAHLLDMKGAFESRNSIVGNELLLEHVHANLEGQKLWAETAFEKVSWLLLKERNIVQQDVEAPFSFAIAETDSTYAYQLVEEMMQKWPFVPVGQEVQMQPNPILKQIISGQISFDQLLLNSYYTQMSQKSSEAWKTAHVLWQEYENPDYLLLEIDALLMLENYERAAFMLNRFPENKQDYRYLEAKLKLALAKKEYQKALGFANQFLSEKYDFDVQKVFESLEYILTHPALSVQAKSEEIKQAPKEYIALLEAYIFLKEQDLVNQIKPKVLKYLSNHPALIRLKKQGLL